MTAPEMNGGPASIDTAPVDKLKSDLKSSAVLTPESEGYVEAIRRWSDAVEMKAVSSIRRIDYCLVLLIGHLGNCGIRHFCRRYLHYHLVLPGSQH